MSIRAHNRLLANAAARAHLSLVSSVGTQAGRQTIGRTIAGFLGALFLVITSPGEGGLGDSLDHNRGFPDFFLAPAANPKLDVCDPLFNASSANIDANYAKAALRANLGVILRHRGEALRRNTLATITDPKLRDLLTKPLPIVQPIIVRPYTGPEIGPVRSGGRGGQ